jgi:hypothetical protein
MEIDPRCEPPCYYLCGAAFLPLKGLFICSLIGGRPDCFYYPKKVIFFSSKFIFFQEGNFSPEKLFPRGRSILAELRNLSLEEVIFLSGKLYSVFSAGHFLGRSSVFVGDSRHGAPNCVGNKNPLTRLMFVTWLKAIVYIIRHRCSCPRTAPSNCTFDRLIDRFMLI